MTAHRRCLETGRKLDLVSSSTGKESKDSDSEKHRIQFLRSLAPDTRMYLIDEKRCTIDGKGSAYTSGCRRPGEVANLDVGDIVERP